MRAPLTRSLIVAVLLVAVLPATIGSAPPQGREPVVERRVQPVATSIYRDTTGILTCGVISCSYYFDREATRTIADVVESNENAINGAAAGAVGVACAAAGAGAVAAAFCVTVGGVAAGAYVDEVKQAARDNGCLRLRNNTPQFALYVIGAAPALVGPTAPISAPPALSAVVAAAAGTTVPVADNSGYCRNR